MHISFSLTGIEDFDPDVVTPLMNVTPRYCWRKGEPSRSGPKRWSCWSYAIGVDEDLEVDELLARMRDLVVPKAAELRGFPAEMQIGVYSNEEQFPGASISVEHLEWIVALGASLDVGSV